MNIKTAVTILLLSMMIPSVILAGPGHDHESGEHGHPLRKAGPNGGVIIEKVTPHIEFYVQEDRHVRLTFLSDQETPAPRDSKFMASMVGGDRQNPMKIAFETKGETLVSTQALPEENNLPFVLTLKPDADTTHYHRIQIDMSHCSGCDLNEYACTCGH
ncbi:MAG: hypothetical protein ACPGN3_13660 [Opitutales bacterium]